MTDLIVLLIYDVAANTLLVRCHEVASRTCTCSPALVPWTTTSPGLCLRTNELTTVKVFVIPDYRPVGVYVLEFRAGSHPVDSFNLFALVVHFTADFRVALAKTLAVGTVLLGILVPFVICDFVAVEVSAPINCGVAIAKVMKTWAVANSFTSACMPTQRVHRA